MTSQKRFLQARFWLRVVGYFYALVLIAAVAKAQAVRTGFSVQGTQERADDTYTGPIPIGFTINFFGSTHSSLYVGTNGYVTFQSGQTGFTPENLVNNSQKIIAPFYADVDTSSAQSGQITWGTGTVNGRAAFAVTWNNVGYFDAKADKTNRFQLVLINRGDRAANDFDFEFNYDRIAWEIGDFDGGRNGLCAQAGCEPPTVGYSNGLTGSSNRSFEFPGSHVVGAFLDTNTTTGLRSRQFGNSGVNGRLLFSVTSGNVTPLTITSMSPNTAVAGAGPLNFTLAGTGFASNATVRWTFNGQTTTLSNVQVPSTTQITGQLPANLLASAGTAQVVVANPTGSPSAPVSFTITAPAGPTVTSLSPTSAIVQSAPVALTINGTGFASGATVRWTMNGQSSNLGNVAVGGPTRITATIPTNLLSAPGSAQIAVVQNNVASSSATFTITGAVNPGVSLRISPMPTIVTDQPGLAVSLGAPLSTAATGAFTLTFVPSAGNLPANYIDPAVRFASGGGTTLDFTIPAGQTEAVIPNNGLFSQGTVAGVITATLTALNSGGVSLLPNPRPSTSITVGRTSPVITSGSVRMVNSAGGFTVQLQGYSTTREVSSVNFAFSPASGGALDGTTTFTVPLNAGSWFDSADGRTNGSRFALEVPFTFSGDMAALGSVAVTLTNSVSSSTPVTGGR